MTAVDADTEARITSGFLRALNAFEFFLADRDGWDAQAVRLKIAAANLRAVGFIENPTREQAENWLAELQGQ